MCRALLLESESAGVRPRKRKLGQSMNGFERRHISLLWGKREANSVKRKRYYERGGLRRPDATAISLEPSLLTCLQVKSLETKSCKDAVSVALKLERHLG